MNYKRYLMLMKFFCLDQTEGWRLEDVCHKKVIKVEEKLDGSLIRFIPIGGKTFAKTKFSFESEQALMAQEIYNKDIILKEFVDWTLENNLAALFELISPMNRIVCLYPKTELRLLQIREEDTGNYLDIWKGDIAKKIPEGIIRAGRLETQPLDYWISLAKTLEGVEGWILTMMDESGNTQMLKLKTAWYLNLHGLVTDSISAPHKIVQMIINDQFENSYLQIPSDFVELREVMQKIEKVTMDWIRTTVQYCSECLKEFNPADRKTFALKYKEDKLFSIMMNTAKEPSNEELLLSNVKIYLSKKTSKLTDCITFLKGLGLDLNIKKEIELE